MKGWPEEGSKEHASLLRDAELSATLLGAVFITDPTTGLWAVRGYLIAGGAHNHRGDAARAWLRLKDYNLAYNHREDRWELLKL